MLGDAFSGANKNNGEPLGVVQKRKVLIVDDEKSVRQSLALLLQNSFEVALAEDGEKGPTEFESFNPDLVLLDVLMPKLDGLDTLKALRLKNTKVPVIMLTGANTVKTAVLAMKMGAVDYLNKPFNIEELTTLMVSTLEPTKVSGNVEPSKTDAGIVGNSFAMQQVFSRITQVAPHATTALITGESGTGKELVAKRIHELSPRKNKPFVAINCAAIPESLIEAELFGHEKGSFTGASEKRVGHCEMANGGTLFLDEIGELSLAVQVKLLRFLQEQEFYRVGGSKPIKVDVRVVAATNRNLEKMVADGSFRQDLFYRVNVISVVLPPLRERGGDVGLLIDFFHEKLSSRYNGKCLCFTDQARRCLEQYSWPGNVRELENTLESLLALSQGIEVSLEDLPRRIKDSYEGSSSGLEVPEVEASSAEEELALNFEEAGRKFEKEMILKALRKTNFIQTKAEDLLGITRRMLKYKMDKLKIEEK